MAFDLENELTDHKTKYEPYLIQAPGANPLSEFLL